MSESNLQVAEIGDLVLVHRDNNRSSSKSKLPQPNRQCDLVLIWDVSDTTASLSMRAISLTGLLPQRRQRESLDIYSDPREFYQLLKEVVVDSLFRLSPVFEPLARPLDELVGEQDYVFLRPSFYAIRKVWLEDGCC